MKIGNSLLGLGLSTSAITMSAIAMLVMSLALTACEKKPLPDIISEYHEGDIVESVLSGQRGQIIKFRCIDDGCYYDVRFQTMPMSTITFMKDYELKPFKGITNVHNG